ncbi:ATP-binding cassette domain-containing protein [bacterium]|nr:ATP-binding cassette domain-containing protein [bacterium]
METNSLTAQVSYAIGQERVVETALSANSGAALQIAGASGVGKTTLLRILARLRESDSGELTLDGKPTAEIDPRHWRRLVTYLPQSPVAFAGAVEDNLRLPFRLGIRADVDFSWDKAALLLDKIGLPPKTFRHQDARTLSGGELQRLALVRSLLVEPQFLLADEPTASLDASTAERVVRLLTDWMTEEQGGLVLVIHDEAPWRELERERLILEPTAGHY